MIFWFGFSLRIGWCDCTTFEVNTNGEEGESKSNLIGVKLRKSTKWRKLFRFAAITQSSRCGVKW